MSPQHYLHHTLFVLNFLTFDADGRSTAEQFWHPTTQSTYAQVRWKDPLTGTWNGPNPVLIWGRGHVCVFIQNADSARWLPERLVRLAENSQTRDDAPVVDTDGMSPDGSRGDVLGLPDPPILHPAVRESPEIPVYVNDTHALGLPSSGHLKWQTERNFNYSGLGMDCLFALLKPCQPLDVCVAPMLLCILMIPRSDGMFALIC